MLKTTATTTSRAARRQNAPRALQLSHAAHKASGFSLQSPLRDGAFLQVSGRPTPPAASPLILFPTPCSPFLQSPHQRMANLTACLASSKPGEVLYPSLGQVATAAQHISTFLDLYRVRASDEVHLAHVKSPTSIGDAPWVPLAPPNTPPPRPRRGTLRRSRSLSDLERGLAVTSDVVHAPGARRAATLEDRPPRRNARAPCAAADSNARRTAEPRRRLHVGPRAPPPDAPLPSPPPPSALLRVKSPLPPVMVAPHAAVVVPQRSAYARFVTVPPSGRRVLRSPQAPYWLKSARTGGAPPKTPRTVRNERRQGWGGMRAMGPAISPAAQHGKERNIA